MSGFGRKITAAFVAGSLCAVPTAAIGAAPIATVAAAPVTAAPANPWLTLSALTTGSSATTAAAVAAQDNGGPGFPPVVPLVVILATIGFGIWIAVDDNGKHDLGISPA